MSENNMTTIAVSQKTLDRLNECGKMGQTKDDLINLFIDFYLRYEHVVSAEVKKK